MNVKLWFDLWWGHGSQGGSFLIKFAFFNSEEHFDTYWTRKYWIVVKCGSY